MAKNWTYMLRILRRNPERIRMDRLADYMREFANLLGADNAPVFKGIKRASTGLKASIPLERRKSTMIRLHQAKTDPDSRPARIYRTIESMLGEDRIKSAQLLDSSEKVVFLFKAPGVQQDQDHISISQNGAVDGLVTGLVGSDDTMHLHLRDHFGRDLKFIVRDEDQARRLLQHFRKETLRLSVHGYWQRTQDGWVPENNRCTVDSFEVLDDQPLTEIFSAFAAVEDSGWTELGDPYAEWSNIRGLN